MVPNNPGENGDFAGLGEAPGLNLTLSFLLATAMMWDPRELSPFLPLSQIATPTSQACMNYCTFQSTLGLIILNNSDTMGPRAHGEAQKSKRTSNA